MSDAQDVTGFRVLLAAGAAVALALGVMGVFGGGVLRSVFGIDLRPDVPGFVGLARLYGAAMVALGIGYLLAAAHPLRNRGLLVVLFAAPLAGAVVLIISLAKGEFSGVRAGVYATLDLAYCLLYFRLYPRPVAEAPPPPSPDETT